MADRHFALHGVEGKKEVFVVTTRNRPLLLDLLLIPSYTDMNGQEFSCLL